MGSVSQQFAVTPDDVERAARAIAGGVMRTPAAAADQLARATGAVVVVKLENLHPTGSFKERGALNRLLALRAEERHRGVVAHSAGNHAQALAYHGTRLGIPVTIVMPNDTPNVKVERTRALGAAVELADGDVVAAEARAHELEGARGFVFVHPYDDAAVIAGQGTIGLELVDEQPDVDAIVVPVGGGGLIAGIAVAVHARRPDVEIVGVQSERFPAMVAALGGRELVCGGPTIAEGIAVARAGTLTTPIVRALVRDVVEVPETRIEDALNLMLFGEKSVAEGAGAAPLAALLEYPDRFRGRRVALVVSGGNVDPRLLSQVIMRGLVRAGQLVTLELEIPDAPGTLARVASIIGDLGGNIVEVSHQRLFSDVSIKSAVLNLAVETRDRAHVGVMVRALESAGYVVVARGTEHG